MPRRREELHRVTTLISCCRSPLPISHPCSVAMAKCWKLSRLSRWIMIIQIKKKIKKLGAKTLKLACRNACLWKSRSGEIQVLLLIFISFINMDSSISSFHTSTLHDRTQTAPSAACLASHDTDVKACSSRVSAWIIQCYC